MNIHTKTARILTSALIAATASLLLYTALFFFIERESQIVNQLEANALSETIEEQETLSLRELLLDTQEARRELNSRFLTEATLVAFLEEVEELGRETGVAARIDSVDIREGDGNSIAKTLNISISATGGWSDMFQYFLLLESLPFSLTIERVALSTSGAGNDGGNSWRGSFDIDVEQIK